MRVALLEIHSNRRECINKDFMGGYGWAFHIGKSVRARAIEAVKKSGEGVPLLTFAYLAAIFREHDHEVQVLRNQLPGPETNLVLIQPTMVDYRHELSWIRRLRALHPGTRIGLIGPFATFRPELFEREVDLIIGGEPEGLAYQLARGEEVANGIVSSPPIADLDTLPFPAWDLFPIQEYGYIPALRERPFLVVLSSRGCVFSCGYCPYPVNFRWKQRSVDNVLDEIGRNIDQFGMRAFLFRDPLFSAKPDRARAIAEGIISRGYRVKWACETRLDLLDEDLIDTFFRAGLRVINVGVESADIDILKGINRVPIQEERQVRLIRHCDQRGVRVTSFYVLGLPGDSADKIRRTVEYAKQLNTHAAMFYLATPFPGTAYYEQVKDQLLTEDYEQMDCFTPVVRHPELSPQELSELLEWAYLSYYYRPSWAIAFARRIIRDFIP